MGRPKFFKPTVLRRNNPDSYDHNSSGNAAQHAKFCESPRRFIINPHSRRCGFIFRIRIRFFDQPVVQIGEPAHQIYLFHTV